MSGVFSIPKQILYFLFRLLHMWLTRLSSINFPSSTWKIMSSRTSSLYVINKIFTIELSIFCTSVYTEGLKLSREFFNMFHLKSLRKLLSSIENPSIFTFWSCKRILFRRSTKWKSVISSGSMMNLDKSEKVEKSFGL